MFDRLRGKQINICASVVCIVRVGLHALASAEGNGLVAGKLEKFHYNLADSSPFESTIFLIIT